jgi:catechol 2,3-dioxygenase-like lactoylglutathione lyase family enzyme
MQNHTITLTVPADRDDVFAFLSRTENLPGWASAFCRGLRPAGRHWLARTAAGDEVYVALRSDAVAGTIDLLTGPRPDEMHLLPLRVVPTPDGAAVTCTFFQSPGLADETFAWLYRELLAGLRRLLPRLGGGELYAPPREAASYYPGLVTARFYKTWDFYTTRLGFRTVAEHDCYVRLVHPGGAQLAVLREETDGAPGELISATEGRGFWLGIDVADADAEYARLQQTGVPVEGPPENKPWGERSFVVRDPNGVLIVVAQRLPVAVPAEVAFVLAR